MAEKRMFTKKITESDAFLDMPMSTQCLYFHLCMNACDDDGFVSNPKKIARMIGATDDDLKILLMKSFIIPFESGVVLIKHWRMHNIIQKDRYHPTSYVEEFSQIGIKENNSYSLLDGNKMYPKCIQDVSKMESEIRLDKIRLDKTNKEKEYKKKKLGEYCNVLLTDEEHQKLQDEFDNVPELIQFLSEYIEMKGYKAKSHYLAIKKWVVQAVKEDKLRKAKLGETEHKEEFVVQETELSNEELIKQLKKGVKND